MTRSLTSQPLPKNFLVGSGVSKYFDPTQDGDGQKYNPGEVSAAGEYEGKNPADQESKANGENDSLTWIDLWEQAPADEQDQRQPPPGSRGQVPAISQGLFGKRIIPKKLWEIVPAQQSRDDITLTQPGVSYADGDCEKGSKD